MGKAVEDCAKRRLVEHHEIEFAIRFMCKRGVKLDDVPVQLARYYYVDIDEVNSILADMEARPSSVTTTTPVQKLRKVA